MADEGREGREWLRLDKWVCLASRHCGRYERRRSFRGSPTGRCQRTGGGALRRARSSDIVSHNRDDGQRHPRQGKTVSLNARKRRVHGTYHYVGLLVLVAQVDDMRGVVTRGGMRAATTVSGGRCVVRPTAMMV